MARFTPGRSLGGRHKAGHDDVLEDIMTAHHIRTEIDGDGIATITIDRPEKRNAMTYAMLHAFTEAVAAVGADDAVRVVIVTGSGGAFCAGTDLADLATIP